MNNPIIINKKIGTFFMAVCSAPPHSFIVIGVEYPDENIVLVDVGKLIPRNERHRNRLYTLLLILLGRLNALVTNENKLINGLMDHTPRLINYMAYEISFENYMEFLTLLKTVNPKINAYIPTSETQDEITFQYQPVQNYTCTNFSTTPEMTKFANESHTISVTNNCRHAAIKMARFNLPKDANTSLSLPTFYNTPLDCVTIVQDGRLIQPLFILPPPPTIYHLDPAKQQVLTMLYHRMEIIVKLKQMSYETREKFEGIRELYTLQAGQQEQSLETLLNAIIQWSIVNREVVDKHRGMHFFFQSTATRNMITQIEKKYAACVMGNK